MEKAKNDKISNNHKEFYSCVKHFRKGYTPSTFGITNKEGHVLTRKTEVVGRWKEYFSQLINGEEMNKNKIKKNNNVQIIILKNHQKKRRKRLLKILKTIRQQERTW